MNRYREHGSSDKLVRTTRYSGYHRAAGAHFERHVVQANACEEGETCVLRSLYLSPRHSCSSGRQGLLLWCGEKPLEDPVIKLLGVASMSFQSPVEFTRWLFLQDRGAVAPWAVLVAGRREVKPCLAAIEAASCGCVDKLRPDARRARLRPPIGSRSGQVSEDRIGVAVGTVVLKLCDSDPPVRSKIFRQLIEHQTPYLDIHIERSAQALLMLLLYNTQINSNLGALGTSVSCALSVLDGEDGEP